MSDVGGADIQADLQDYLNAKGINTLFIKIVENLLIEKPDNPIQFIVKYLQREYPDQTGSSGDDNQAGEWQKKIRDVKKKSKIPVTFSLTISKSDASDSSSDEDSDEEEDELGDIPDIVRQPAALNRRVSVSAESNTRVSVRRFYVVPICLQSN